MISRSRTCIEAKTKLMKSSMADRIKWFSIDKCRRRLSDILKRACKIRIWFTAMEWIVRHQPTGLSMFITKMECRGALTTMSMSDVLILIDIRNYFFFILIKKSSSYIRSSEDISSGYSSTEANSMALSRTASLSNGTRYRPKTRRNEVSFECVLHFCY